MCCQDVLPHKGARPAAIAHSQTGVAVHAVETGIITQIGSRPWPNSSTQAGFGAANDWDKYLQAADARCANPAVADPLTCKAGKRKRAPRDCRWAECDNKLAQGRPSFLTMPYTGKRATQPWPPRPPPGQEDASMDESHFVTWAKRFHSERQRYTEVARASAAVNDPKLNLKVLYPGDSVHFYIYADSPSADLHAPYTAEMQSDPAAPINRLRQCWPAQLPVSQASYIQRITEMKKELHRAGLVKVPPSFLGVLLDDH